jgi:hypothetical protein
MILLLVHVFSCNPNIFNLLHMHLWRRIVIWDNQTVITLVIKLILDFLRVVSTIEVRVQQSKICLPWRTYLLVDNYLMKLLWK